MNKYPQSGIDYDLYRRRASQLRAQALDDVYAAVQVSLSKVLRHLARLTHKARNQPVFVQKPDKAGRGHGRLPSLG